MEAPILALNLPASIAEKPYFCIVANKITILTGGAVW